MTQAIVYRQDNGRAAIVYPTPEALSLIGLQAIAAKDVPTGKPYKIIDVADIPSDRSDRDGWTVDEADLTDGVGA